MSPSARKALVAFSTPALAVVLGGLYAVLRRGGTHELPSFFIWSIPLGIEVAVFARKPRYLGLSTLPRALVTALVGFVLGVGWTAVGWLIMGPWMLAWDFPVLYCWTIAGASGALAAAVANSALPANSAAVALGTVLAPLAVLWWYAARPWPAVFIVYRENPSFDSAQRVFDSVLTEPHPSGQGRGIK